MDILADPDMADPVTGKHVDQLAFEKAVTASLSDFEPSTAITLCRTVVEVSLDGITFVNIGAAYNFYRVEVMQHNPLQLPIGGEPVEL